MTKKKDAETQLRQTIRKIVREELKRMQKMGDPEWMEHDLDLSHPNRKMPDRPEPRDNFDSPDPFGHDDLSPEHPPWINYSRPQPDPNRKSAHPPHYPEWPSPYTPDPESGFGNPPYISKRQK